MMRLTERRARQIIDAFGPCSVLYETTTARELVADSKEAWNDGLGLLGYVRTLLTCEEVWSDRLNAVARESEAFGESPEGTHTKTIAEGIRMRSAILTRLLGLGIDLRCQNIFCNASQTPATVAGDDEDNLCRTCYGSGLRKV